MVQEPRQYLDETYSSHSKLNFLQTWNALLRLGAPSRLLPESRSSDKGSSKCRPICITVSSCMV